ncbi:MAG: methyl-accepting chemotaxis protein, partial [Pseudothermotoga sp.]
MKSVRSRILFWFLTSTITLLIVLGIFIYFQTQNTVLPLMKELSAEVVRGNAAMVGEWINGRSLELKAIAQSSTMDFLVTATYWVAQQLSEKLKDRKDVFETYFVCDYKGQMWETDSASIVSLEATNREFYKRIVGQNQPTFIGEIHQSALSKKNVFMIAHRVVDSYGNVSGIFGGTISLEKLSNMTSQIEMGQVGYGWIVDGTGLVLAHPNKDIILKLNILNSSKEGYSGLEELGKKMTQGQTDSGLITLPDKSKEFVFFTPITASPGWSLGMSIPEKDLMARANTLLRIMIIVIAIIIGIVVLVSFIVGNTISKPIKTLAQGVEQFGGGDLTTQFQAKGKDEIAHMASALNSMAASLRESMRSVKNSAETVDNFSTELEQIAQQGTEIANKLSTRAEEINKNIQNASASIEQVSSGVEEVAASAQNVSKSAQGLTEKA